VTELKKRRIPRPLAVLLAVAMTLLGQPAVSGIAHADTGPVTHGLLGEYFQQTATNGPHDFGKQGSSELAATLDFGDLLPVLQANAGRMDYTSARWTGQITAPTSGDYTFSAIGDNGFRLWIDGNLVIDHWVGDWDNEVNSTPVTLAAGVAHTFRLDYFNDWGGANMHLRWAGPGIAKQIVPQSAFTVPGAATTTHGLEGQYYTPSNDTAHDWATLGASTLEPSINFPDLTGPFNDYTGGTEHRTARWTGELQVPATGDYTFYAIGDNGFRLWIDGQPVIDHWVGDWDKEQTSTAVHLTAGERHIVKMELFQDVGGANLFLRWSSASIPKTIVPESAFYTPPGFQVFPVTLTMAADGRALTADFDGAVTVGDLQHHLTVTVDGTPYPLDSVAVDPNDNTVVDITLGQLAFKGQRVKFSYDGQGGLLVGGAAVPQLIRNATNNSTQRMTTPWTALVDKSAPLPEYPRPQQVRPLWQNLNGQWQFAGVPLGAAPTFGTTLAEKITVPYPEESLLSGIERHDDHMFYRKLVTVPSGWNIGSGQRLRLNFGAVDYLATVYVNGTKVAEHKGGYTAFTADITDALKGTGPQEIVVDVTDTTDANTQQVGKQSANPSGIFYTASSGIWQTVWMEPVPDKSIDDVVATPDITTSQLAVTVHSASATPGVSVVVHAYDKAGNNAGAVEGAVNTKLILPVKKEHLWTPDDPYLYTYTVELKDGRTHDKVSGYFGMRSVAIAKVGDYQKIVLNGKPTFSLAQLDQGFWPDGLYTAPTDAAMLSDLQKQKDLGFNAVRKHIKMEPARWYYDADKLGLMVWQDFVSGNNSTDQAKADFIANGKAEMTELHNFPSVIGYVVMNEGWGEWSKDATGQIATDAKAYDPSRLIDAHSGVNCCNSHGDSGAGDIIDHHDYNNTDPAHPDATRAAMDGEHGGFTLRTPGHMWPGGAIAIYSGVADKSALTKRYVDNTSTFYLAAARQELSGSVYTQVTDVEGELNGLWTYDRRVEKVDEAAVRAINQKVIAAGAEAGTPISYPGNACWSLDEGTGTTAHDGCGSSDLTVNGASWVVGNGGGSALHFNGVDQSAGTAAPVVDTTKDYTVSAWVTLDKLPGNYATAVSEDGRATANPFYLQYGQGYFAFSLPGNVRATYSVNPVLGQWYHLVGVRDHTSNTVKLYVNGALAGSTAAGTDGQATGPLTIGKAKYAGQDTDFWNGAIDDVRIVGRALSDTEVAAL
jgi:hypothetical protein